MRLAPWLLLFSSAVLSETHLNDIPYDGIVAEEEFEVDAQFSPTYEASRCCTDADPVDLLIVSTMDGKVQALDVANEGRLVWQSDLDGAALLGGNLGKMEPLSAEGDRFVLVPSLDGSLYMFSMEQRVLEPIPLSTDMLLHSVKIGKEAVAGGKSITTTGVDPVTGKIRYHCTSAHCEQEDDGSQPTSTLVFRRVSHSIRAVDALNGAEKWNLSVSEYDASLVRRKTAVNESSDKKKNMKFVISPPKGTITALDSCGRTLWTTSLGVHIARTWHLEDYLLSEISLFDSNIHSISTNSKEETALTRPESLFYLGTIENDPFILCSEKLRTEMKRLSKQIDYADHGKRVDSNSGAIIKAGGETYQVADGVLDEVLGRAFKQSISRLKERRKLREIAGPELNELDEMQIALPAPDNVNTGPVSLNSCDVPNDHVLMIGEDNIRNAEPHGDSGGDQGWFILRPSSSVKSLHGFLTPPAQCTAHFVKKSLHLENDVNPLWRLLAIFLLFVTGVIGMFKFSKLRRRWREAEVAIDSEEIVNENSRERIQSLSLPPQVAQLSEPAPVRQTASDDVAAASVAIKNDRAVDAASRRRNMSTRSGTDISASDNFESTFLRDYEPVKVLGRGGFGVVFEAINKLDQCHYAVKRIAVGNNECAIERVLREVRAMAMLDHTSIIRYCHTWIERPPEGWQKETDKAMLVHMQSKRKGAIETVKESTQSISAAKDASSLGIKAPPNVSSRTEDDESWADDPIDCDHDATSTDESSEDDDFEIASRVSVQPERSDSIIFDKGSARSRCTTSKSDSSGLLQLESKLALMTSVDEELLPCRSTANNVYLYIQMQLCNDKTLYAWLLSNTRKECRDPERMKKWMRQLLSAVDYIHEKGLIHRDIKPQNIFFFGSSDSLKIGDLGLVSKGANDQTSESEESKRRSSSSVSSLHTDNVGTRTYMSPEQLANQPYTSKVDVFSLGLIFTELNIPFTTLMERSKVLSGLQSGLQPEQLQNRPELASFIEWLTKKQPDERPTCKEILDSKFLQEKRT